MSATDIDNLDRRAAARPHLAVWLDAGPWDAVATAPERQRCARLYPNPMVGQKAAVGDPHARRLPPGFGLLTGALASIGLWAGIALLIARMLG